MVRTVVRKNKWHKCQCDIADNFKLYKPADVVKKICEKPDDQDLGDKDSRDL